MSKFYTALKSGLQSFFIDFIFGLALNFNNILTKSLFL